MTNEEAIMKIADERDIYKASLKDCKEANTKCAEVIQDLKRQIKIKDEYLALIVGIGFDYDGEDGSIDGLKSVIDQLVDYARKAIDNDDKSIIYGIFDDDIKRNILLEEIKKGEINERQKKN